MLGGYNPKRPKILEDAPIEQTIGFPRNSEQVSSDLQWTAAQKDVNRFQRPMNERRPKLKLILSSRINKTHSKSFEWSDWNQSSPDDQRTWDQSHHSKGKETTIGLRLKRKLPTFEVVNETYLNSTLEKDHHLEELFVLGECCRKSEEQAQHDKEEIESLTAQLHERNAENNKLQHEIDEMKNHAFISRGKDDYEEKLKMICSQREIDKQEFDREKRCLEEELEICKHQREDEKSEKEGVLREIDFLQNELYLWKNQVNTKKETNDRESNERLQREVFEREMKDILRDRDQTLLQVQELEKQVHYANMQRNKYASEKDYALHQKQVQEEETEKETKLKREIHERLQREVFEQEMKDILRERDQVLLRVEELEKQVHYVKMQRDKYASEKDYALHQKQVQEEETEKEISKLKRDRDEAFDKIHDYKEQDRESRIELTKLRSERDNARQQVQEYKKQAEDANIQILKLREKEKSANGENSKVTPESEARIKKLVAEIQSLKSEQDRLQRVNRKINEDNDRYKRQVNELVKAKDDALTRLSKVAGAKLTQGNAAITDLSDDNRPTKISEKFSELYDNAWTDAFEDIECLGIDEREGIDILLAVLKKTFELCSQVEDKYEEKILQAVRTIPSVFQSEGFKDCTVKTNIQVIKSLCEIRLSMENDCSLAVERMILSYLPNFLQTLSTKFDVSNTPSKLVHYTRSCTRLCWLMRVRDPPLHLQFDIQSDGPFTQDYYRQYTKSGKNVDYMVWPVLFLHKNGPLLAKGVAQPK